MLKQFAKIVEHVCFINAKVHAVIIQYTIHNSRQILLVTVHLVHLKYLSYATVSFMC